MKQHSVWNLPGQYDQRADSAMQCIQIISGDDKAVVASAKTYVLKGKLSTEDVEKIKHYCINPVDSRKASMEKLLHLKWTLQFQLQLKLLKVLLIWTKRHFLIIESL